MLSFLTDVGLIQTTQQCFLCGGWMRHSKQANTLYWIYTCTRRFNEQKCNGAYSAVLPVTYSGQPLTLWNQFQSSFSAPSFLQMKVDENRVLRSNASKFASSVYVCGCELCEARVDVEVSYFHSVMDEMMLMISPVPRHVEAADNPNTTGAVYAAMARTEQIVHIYDDYAMLHEVD